MSDLIVIRTSERAALKRCPQRWWWGWREGWKPKRPADALWFGSGVHLALAKWYLRGGERGPTPAETWARWVVDEERYIKTQGVLIDETKWISARDLGFAMLMDYVDTYGKDDNWDVIATEQPFQVRIQAAHVPGGYIIFSGTFDGVYRDLVDGSLWLMEHKTASGFPNIGFLELDDQASGYFMAAEITLRHKGLISEHEHLSGIMYNYLRKKMPDDRPKDAQGRALNKDGSISKQQDVARYMRHPVWRSVEQRQRTKQAIINEAELMVMYREHRLSITKTPTQDCTFCPFFQMCQLHESDADWMEFRDAMFDRRDPYSDHRLAIKSAGSEVI
jgi:hypothetical protein